MDVQVLERHTLEVRAMQPAERFKTCNLGAAVADPVEIRVNVHENPGPSCYGSPLRRAAFVTAAVPPSPRSWWDPVSDTSSNDARPSASHCGARIAGPY